MPKESNFKLCISATRARAIDIVNGVYVNLVNEINENMNLKGKLAILSAEKVKNYLSREIDASKVNLLFVPYAIINRYYIILLLTYPVELVSLLGDFHVFPQIFQSF